ncbi:MAG: SCO1664 family protein [Ilumatobacteraceae bacterium]
MPCTETSRGLLTAGDLEVIGRMPNSSNATLLVNVTCGEESVRAVYKPGRGERPLWDFPPGLYRREVAAYELSRALRWHQVPCTVLRDGPYDEGSVQLFVDFDPAEHYFSIHESRPDLHDELRRMAVFDIIANNTDRKGGHVLLGTDGNVWGIDHGVCFSDDFKLRTVIWEFAGEEIAESMLGPVATLAAEPPSAVTDLLSPSEEDAMMERIGWLLDNRVFPSPGSRYEYPWPIL